MAYLGTGAVELTAAQLRQTNVAHWINARRASGWSEERIRGYLDMASKMRTLPAGHPCAGPNMENTCTGDDLIAAYVTSTKLLKRPGGGFGLLALVAVAGLGYFLYERYGK